MQKDITSHVKKSNLELKDDMTQYLKDEISSNKVELVVIKVNLEKGQEAMEKCTSTVKANFTNERKHGQTWPKMLKLKLSMPNKKLMQMLLG